MADRTGANVSSGRTWDLIGPVKLGRGQHRNPEDPIVFEGLTLQDLNPPFTGEITGPFHHAATIETGWMKLPFSID
jgi:hypothetical protein